MEVEAHGVERRRRRDDHRRVPAFAGQAFELLAEMPADALSSVPVTHVEVGELRDARPDARPDNPNRHELGIRKRSQCNSTCGEMPLALGEALTTTVAHMFRLDENLFDFYTLVKEDGELSWCGTGAGRMLRAPTVFEDVV